MAQDTPSPLTILRWASLVVVAANIAFIADYSALGNAPTVAEVSAEYGSSVIPAGFARAIGAAILFAFLLFYVEVLWPRRTRVRIYDYLVVPLALAAVLASCWIVAYRQRDIALATTLTAASAALGGVMFMRIATVSPGEHSAWLRVPFSLYFGAMTIALLVSLTQWANARELVTENMLVSDDQTIALLAMATVIGGLVALRYGDPVFPAVIASAAGAAFVVQRAQAPHIGNAALIVCAGLLLVALLGASGLALRRRSARDVLSRRRESIARKAQDEGWYVLGQSSSMMGL
jgi:hypothetical protein